MNEFSPNSEHLKNLLVYSRQTINELLNWNDEIPDHPISGETEENRFKVRGNLFQAIIAQSGFLKMLSVVPKQHLPAISKFEEDFQGMNFPNLTQRKDIERGNQILEILLESIDTYLQNNK